jgi:hypothetical protein
LQLFLSPLPFPRPHLPSRRLSLPLALPPLFQRPPLHELRLAQMQPPSRRRFAS